MSFWLKALEVVSFVLPHVSNLVKELVSKYNPPLEADELQSDQEYRSSCNHLIKILSCLCPDQDDLVTEASNLLQKGLFIEGMRKVFHIETRYKILMSDHLVRPAVLNTVNGSNPEKLIRESMKIIDSVERTFPLAYNRYVTQNRDMLDFIENLRLPLIDKFDAMKFFRCLELLEPRRELSGEVFLGSFRPASYLVGTEVCTALINAGKPFSDFYKVFVPKKGSDSGTWAQVVPNFLHARYEDLTYVYNLPQGQLRVMDFLLADMREPFSQDDPNFSYNAILNSMLNGDLMFFRCYLTMIQEGLFKLAGIKVTINLLLDHASIKQLILSGKEYGIEVLEAYLTKLKTYSVCLMILESTHANSNGLSRKTLLQQRRGCLGTSPRTGNRFHWNDNWKRLDEEGEGSAQVRNNISLYPAVPPVSSQVFEHGRWGVASVPQGGWELGQLLRGDTYPPISSNGDISAFPHVPDWTEDQSN